MAEEAKEPPRTGKGSGKEAWASYAVNELGLDKDAIDGLSRDEIIELVDLRNEDSPPDPDPEPAGEDEEPGPCEVTVDHDCRINYGGQLVTLARGQRVTGGLAAYLARTGGPVTPVDDTPDEG